MPDVTLEAFREGGNPHRSIDQDVATARAEIAALAAAGVDLAAVTAALEDEGVKAFAEAYDAMIDAIRAKMS